MLTYLTVWNWQCFEKYVLRFDPLVTVLTGSNGIGKSALVRALKWVALNEWPGKANTFIRWGQAEACVKLGTDAHRVERRKGAGINTYRLNGHTIKFDSVNRRTVPDEITDAIKLTPDNFQDQRDIAFWFSLTAGGAAKALNRIVNLEAIDGSLTAVASELRIARSREQVCRERLESCRNLTESLAWVPEAERRMGTIVQLETDMARKRVRIAQAERLLRTDSRCQAVRQSAARLIQAGKSALSVAESAAADGVLVAGLEVKLRDLQGLEDRKCRLEKELQQKRALLTSTLIRECPTCGRTGPLPARPRSPGSTSSPS